MLAPRKGCGEGHQLAPLGDIGALGEVVEAIGLDPIQNLAVQDQSGPTGHTIAETSDIGMEFGPARDISDSESVMLS